mgnify:CR=1 FL=1
MKKTTKTTTKKSDLLSFLLQKLFIFPKLKWWSQNILPSFSCWHLTPFFQNTVLRNLFKMTFFFLWNMFLSLSFEKVVLLSKNWEEVCVRFQSERQQPQWVVIVKNLYISKIIKRILTFGEEEKKVMWCLLPSIL